jgi:NAD(P)-dependent dehydrogenase (short-subunit alcohol dehydrogenase family)
MDLRGGVAIVTGAGGGIGGAVARRFAEEGMDLVLADLDGGSVRRTEALLSLADDRVVVTRAGDVGDPDHHRDLVEVAGTLGGPILSVLNAGVYLPGLSWELPLEHWELHVRVNLWGVVHGIRAVVPAMVEQGRGHVVAMASGAGLVATPSLAPYVGTKHAVVGVMESLHHELARVAPGVHTSVVCPGNVRTPMAANSLAAAGIEHEHLSPEAERVAHAVRAGNAAGEAPSTVADAIVDAVVENRFWVLPQPEVAWAAGDRVERLRDGRPPIDLLG